ncbi:unnamed protein product [Brachionus calyciflorus]|uniref:Cadherin domain-containing protein n=1 Tax=Brachionus calyciflorus TaxID=104777 RepID=A0A814IKB4_9BILA|nr:unnamed protein product [Brachionus calyciflorus]
MPFPSQNEINSLCEGLKPAKMNNSPDTLVIKAQAYDSDINENSRLTYHLINNETNSSPIPFQIKSDTGEIYAKRFLNREQKDFYVLNIAAVDNGPIRLAIILNTQLRLHNFLQTFKSDAANFASLRNSFFCAIVLLSALQST